MQFKWEATSLQNQTRSYHSSGIYFFICCYRIDVAIWGGSSSRYAELIVDKVAHAFLIQKNVYMWQ
jgi:hypothetical protein